MSLPQMMNLGFVLSCSPTGVNLSSKILGLNNVPLRFSTSKHVVFDLMQIVKSYKGTSMSFQATVEEPTVYLTKETNSAQDRLYDQENSKHEDAFGGIRLTRKTKPGSIYKDPEGTMHGPPKVPPVPLPKRRAKM